MLRLRIAIIAPAFCLACLALLAGSAAAAGHTGCAPSGYSYVGVASRTAVHGVSVRLASLQAPAVEDGHVAAWVGVSSIGTGIGPPQWIQVGVSAFEGERESRLYYELALPGRAPRYVPLTAAEQGRNYQVAVLEVAKRHDWWRVWLDGEPVSAAFYLPGSSGHWSAVATAENWSSAPACNSFIYRFEKLAVARAPGGSWGALPIGQRYLTPAYWLQAIGLDGFFAASASAT